MTTLTAEERAYDLVPDRGHMRSRRVTPVGATPEIAVTVESQPRRYAWNRADEAHRVQAQLVVSIGTNRQYEYLRGGWSAATLGAALRSLVRAALSQQTQSLAAQALDAARDQTVLDALRAGPAVHVALQRSVQNSINGRVGGGSVQYWLTMIDRFREQHGLPHWLDSWIIEHTYDPALGSPLPSEAGLCVLRFTPESAVVSAGYRGVLLGTPQSPWHGSWADRYAPTESFARRVGFVEARYAYLVTVALTLGEAQRAQDEQHKTQWLAYFGREAPPPAPSPWVVEVPTAAA